MSAISSRGDLLRLLQGLAGDDKKAVAEGLGFADQGTVASKQPQQRLEQDGKQKRELPRPPPPKPPLAQAQQNLAPVPFWRLVGRQSRSGTTATTAIVPAAAQSATAPPWRNAPTRQVPGLDPLLPWARLQGHLREALAPPQATTAVDVERLVERVSRGQALYDLPPAKLQRWADTVHVVEDRSNRLAHLWADQRRLAVQLAHLFPDYAITHYRCDEALYWPLAEDLRGRWFELEPEPGSFVLVLGDLGALSGGAELERWLAIGRQVQAQGAQAVALMACPADRWPAALASLWQPVAWEGPNQRPSGSAADIEARAERLLSLAAPAVRLEPGLLRALRRLLPEADAGTECDAWQHPAVISQSSDAATLSELARAHFKARFEKEPPALRQRALDTIRRWRGRVSPAIWFEEILALDAPSRDLVSVDDHEDAAAFMQYLAGPVWQGQGGTKLPAGRRMYVRGMLERLKQSEAWREKTTGDALHRLWWALNRDRSQSTTPKGFDPSRLPEPPDQSTRNIAVVHHGQHLLLEPGNHAQGSLIAVIRSVLGVVEVEHQDFWQSGQPPPWASAWGEDEYGLWVEFELPDHPEVSPQRLRWIVPGRFMMGSPEDEHGRDGYEGPQREVRLAEGFWLCDTACPQALYEAAMGKNASKFEGKDHPVDGVNWDQAKAFIERINERVPGLDLTLPSEAQWEYACRAGTATPFSFGQTITTDQVNFNGNHPYREGDGKGQYREQTVPVKSLPANPWGLYEIHGNVWEWVEDRWHDNYEGAPADGSAWVEGGGSRVVRGGSWDIRARFVRCASRYHYAQAYRIVHLGFRCARVQAGAEPAGAGSRRPAERRRGASSSGGAVVVNVNAGDGPAEVELPKRGPLILRSDREVLTLETIECPAWASAMGRDRYGLVATLALRTPKPGQFELVRDGAVCPQPNLIVQRLRWIPPGRFLMGSPEDERGRTKSEGPQHEITLEQGYWLFDTPCTQDLYQAVMAKNLSKFEGLKNPADSVTWEQAQTFIQRINQGIEGLNLSLPSEAQWEYACRAGTQSPTYAGDNSAEILDRIAWYGANTKQTRAVGLKAPNDWGLYDMLGNVWEWVEDRWHENYYGAPVDGSAWVEDGERRVFRGGSWNYRARYVRCAFRALYALDIRYGHLGFRCARVQV